MQNTLKKIEFILELEKLKAVLRKNKPIGLDRYENSAEHSWHVSLLVMILAEDANRKIDTHKVIKMMLLHDIESTAQQDSKKHLFKGISSTY